jgi:hypothetical protein
MADNISLLIPWCFPGQRDKGQSQRQLPHRPTVIRFLLVPSWQVIWYNFVDPYNKNLHVYVYAETWDSVKSIEEEDTRRKTFIMEACKLHNVSRSFFPFSFLMSTLIFSLPFLPSCFFLVSLNDL